MRRAIGLLSLAILITTMCSASVSAQRRPVVVVRHPHPVRHALMVRGRLPIRRVMPREVVVRTARRNVVVNAPLVYLPALAWRAVTAPLPVGDRLVSQDSETITREEEWVDTNFGVDSSGNALFLNIDGKTKLNFAEVTFANGNVQVVDFNEATHGAGNYRLLDFADGRHVSTVRILAKSESDSTKLTVYLSR
jgi:hypothetical protein